jgi:hypothetical protein
MPNTCRIIGIIFVVSLFLPSSPLHAAKKLFTSNELRAIVKLHAGAIIDESDSVTVNNRLLQRGRDYRIDYINGLLYLNGAIGEHDTLSVCYTPLPTWLKKQYGLMPGTVESSSYPAYPVRSPVISPAGDRGSSKMTLKGAKRFQILSQSGGSSQFNQSLELSVAGELTPGVTVSASIADRGYDPIYGTINSRISELDKLNLKVQSDKFYSEMGDLEIAQRADFNTPLLKRVSGLRARYRDRGFESKVLLGRPRGQFKTVKFNGMDRVQGPYQVAAENTVAAIVPGSERVWVDGQLLERGADKDYIMDYPSATITFSLKIMIDTRSRIEIDFEPLATDYQRGIYQFAGGASLPDSAFYMGLEMTGEGDDKERLKSGAISPDDVRLLQSIGDSTTHNFRNGATLDSTGDYVERQDTSGTSYFEYVGQGEGEFRVIFTALGQGRGDYVYEGGNKYRYIGKNKGDFSPVVRIPVPSYERFYEIELGARPDRNKRLKLIARLSDFDRNLASNLNDYNNSGGQYIFVGEVGASPSIYSTRPGAGVTINMITSNFNSRGRRNSADFDRKYLVPDRLVAKNDQREVTSSASILTPGPYNLYINSGLLDYQYQFRSYYGTLAVYPDKKDGFLPTLSYTRLKADYDIDQSARKGNNEGFKGEIEHKFNDYTEILGTFDLDRRWHTYESELRGTAETNMTLTLLCHGHKINLERYREDTLTIRWKNNLIRERVSVSLVSDGRYLNGSLYMVGQRMTLLSRREDQFMIRADASYVPSRGSLSIKGSYSLADENRFERGLGYIEVEPGQGRYIYEDGQYVPDLDGNFVELEEIHSNRMGVKTGEKSFYLAYNPDNIYIKFLSNINEELLSGGNRSFFWLLPFYSKAGQPYLYRRLYYSGELKFFRFSGYYLLGLSTSHTYESRLIAMSNYKRYEGIYKAELNECAGVWRFIQEGSYFEYIRDSYYNSPGNIDGFKCALSLIRTFDVGQIAGSLAYRFAEDQAGARVRLAALEIDSKLRFFKAGESSLEFEVYHQVLFPEDIASFRLTDNYSGTRGFKWSVGSDYNISKLVRVAVSFRGQHSEGRKPRLVGRGELIADF